MHRNKNSCRVWFVILNILATLLENFHLILFQNPIRYRRGHEDAEINAVFSKYDVDGDRVLSAVERKLMEKDLENKKVFFYFFLYYLSFLYSTKRSSFISVSFRLKKDFVWICFFERMSNLYLVGIMYVQGVSKPCPPFRAQVAEPWVHGQVNRIWPIW